MPLRTLRSAWTGIVRLALPLAGELSLLRRLFPPAGGAVPPGTLPQWRLLDPAALPAPPRGAFALLSLFPYEGEAGAAVRGAKYGGHPFPCREAAQRLREMLDGAWSGALPPAFTPAVVPVPATPWTYLRRGFHLPASVAARLARERGYPFLPSLLRRSRAGSPQASLPRSRRGANVRNAFRPGPRPAWAPPDVILVDDVATSGATASACAAALKAGGARFIVVVTLARASAPGRVDRKGAHGPGGGG